MGFTDRSPIRRGRSLAFQNRENHLPGPLPISTSVIFLASSSTLGYEYASTSVFSGGCERSFMARTSISTALSIVSEVTTAALNEP